MTHPIPRRLVLLGSPVSHSLSRFFQDAALRAAGIPLHYEPLDVPVASLTDVLAELIGQHAAGNVTIPHKRAVFAACSWSSEVAVRAQAVNTFWVDDGRLCGENTDVHGFAAAVATLGARQDDAMVACLGAGGAAAAVCVATERWPGAHVHLMSRRPQAASLLAARFPHVTVCDFAAWPTGVTLVVNATPVGMDGDDLPFEPATLPRDADVMDLVYRRGETALVHRARSLGHRAIDGQEMLVQQGAHAFACWFGISPDQGVMRHALGLAAL